MRECPPSSPSASVPSGLDVEVDAAVRSAPQPRRAPRSPGPRRPPGGRGRGPALSVSSAWRAGESSGAIAAASPPCAQKLELSARGLRETTTTRPPPAAASRATWSPAAPPPTTATSQACGSARSRGQGRRVRYPQRMGLYFHHPSSLEHDTGSHPENAERIRAIEAALEAAGWPGLERIEAAPAANGTARAGPRPRARRARIELVCVEGGGTIDADTIVVEASLEAALRARRRRGRGR